MLVTLYKMIEVHFRLPGTIDFHIKAKNESCTAPRSSFRQDLKYENFMSSLGRLRQNNVLKSGPHVQHDYFSSFNQSNHWFVALLLPMTSFFFKLPNNGNKVVCTFTMGNGHFRFARTFFLLPRENLSNYDVDDSESVIKICNFIFLQ